MPDIFEREWKPWFLLKVLIGCKMLSYVLNGQKLEFIQPFFPSIGILVSIFLLQQCILTTILHRVVFN